MNCLKRTSCRQKGDQLCIAAWGNLPHGRYGIYEAMAAIFIAQAYVPTSASTAIVILTANIAAIGAAGIPGAGLGDHGHGPERR